MLLATSDSDVAKKPRLRLTMCRSSAVRPSGERHSAMSACMDTSDGIQWFAQPDRYFRGKSWFTSARALIIRLSETSTREAPRSMVPRPVGSASMAAALVAEALVAEALVAEALVAVAVGVSKFRLT